MSRATQILADAKVELCEAEAHLARADGMEPANSVLCKQHALNAAHSTIKRLQLFERQLESELFERV